MRKIIFSSNISNIELDLPDSLVICHEMYQKPKVNGGSYIDWQDFKKRYVDFDNNQLVLVGLNRMITPHNRCDMINDYLQTMTKNKEKVVIDSAPFIGEPWRVWFHFSVCFGSWLNVDYSYPIEGAYNDIFYMNKDNDLFNCEKLKYNIHGVDSNIKTFSSSFDFYDGDFEWYQDIKTSIVNNNTQPKSMINKLLNECNRIFDIDFGYDSYLENKKITLPNLGVYRFVACESKRRMDIYNLFGVNNGN